ncbi:hypothetical protein FACS1894109_04970 [Spirochaetia bacterium]|nr:hypothetical protein FACS1894109_04970 [Spirochaetia bacterium]
MVSSVVNNVGVNLNTASASLLKYVSGINSSLAKKIVKYRDEKGRIASREELVTVPGMGPKSFEQCAGFLKIPESPNPLDNTWVHPENYGVAQVIRETITTTGNLSHDEIKTLKEKHSLGDTTINDIIEELKKPNRDPRDGFPKPIMQKGVVTFEDLHEGMMITGKIKNVVDFGAFVDLGIKETALVHISELSDHFVKDPMDAVKVGDVLEFRIISLDLDRRRIGLSRKKDPAQRESIAAQKASIAAQQKPEHNAAGAGQGSAEQGMPGSHSAEGHGDKKRAVAVKKTEKAGAGSPAAAYSDTVRSNSREVPHGENRSDNRQGGFRPGPRPAGQPGGNAGGYGRGGPGGDHNRSAGGVGGKDDDGTMYNPFAEALRKMQEKQGKPGKK